MFASVGDVTFVLTSYFVVHGYLRDVGHHVANLQRSANEMEEMVRLKAEHLGVEDRPHASNLKVAKGGIVFENVTFRYGSHAVPLFSDFSLICRSRPATSCFIPAALASASRTFCGNSPVRLYISTASMSVGRIASSSS